MTRTLFRSGLALSSLLVIAVGFSSCVPVPYWRNEALTTAAPVSETMGAAPEHAGEPILPAALALPESFRYAVDVRPAGSTDEAATHISGEYRGGDWSQTTRSEDPSNSSYGQFEEAMVVGGTSYTRPASEARWTRWPSLGFDASYGPVSPFTILRLYPLADQRAERVPSVIAGAPEATFRVQASFSGETLKQLLSLGIATVAPDEQTRSALEAQVAPLAAPQTITYWLGEDGRIYRAAATLTASDETGQPAPWVEATWRFWGYDDSEITIQPPADFLDASTSVLENQAAMETAAAPIPGAAGSLLVRVFSAPGIPAQRLGVIVYPSGTALEPLDWRTDPASEFSLPPGTYDVLVQMDYAQEWLRSVSVVEGETITREVVFDFGALELTALQHGAPAAVEMVVYPAGDRENWIEWRSENPATISLRGGRYDVEIAAPGPDGTRQTLQGVVVRPGETTRETVELNP